MIRGFRPLGWWALLAQVPFNATFGKGDKT